MESKMKLLSVVVVVAMVLSACAAGVTPEQTPTGQAADSQTATEPVVLNYWAAPLSRPEIVSEVWGKHIQTFKAETGVDVTFEVIPWADVVSKLTTAITSGEGPDIAGTGNNMSVVLAPTGALLKLTPERMAVIGGKEKFIESVMKVTGAEGEDPVTVPLNGGSGLLVYDREAYESVGMTKVPEKWEDFIAYAQQLTDGNVYGYGMFGKPTQCWKMFNNVFKQVRMGEPLDENGIPAFASEGGRDALKLIADLIGKYKIVPPVAAEWTADDMISAFINGDIKACYIDAENLSILDNSEMAGKFEIDILPYIFPGKTEGVPCVSHAGGTNVGIFAGTKYEKEALAFLEFITRKDVNVEICTSFGVLSSVKGAYEKSDDERTKKMVKILETATVPMPLRPYYLQSLDVISATVQNVMYQASQPGGVTDEFLDKELERAMGEIAPLVK
jgi:multiple sugar transport system substrate-binding protein